MEAEGEEPGRTDPGQVREVPENDLELHPGRDRSLWGYDSILAAVFTQSGETSTEEVNMN